MNEKQARIFIVLGPMLVLFAVAIIYYDFFVSKVGPLGSNRHWTIYTMYGCNVLLGIITTIQAAITLKNLENK